jgi:hypothetical protein
MRRVAAACLTAVVALAVTACATQPAPPEPGAPAETTAADAAGATPVGQPGAAPAETPGAQGKARAAAPARSAAPPAAAGPVEPETAASEPPAPGAAPARAEPPAPPAPEYRDVTIPAGTRLSVVLDTTVASDKSQVEDRVVAYLDQPVVVDELAVLPRNARVTGTVTEATRSGKVKGRARIAIRFTGVDSPTGDAHDIRTAAIAREAQSTKKDDAKKVGIGAVGGAIIGGIAGGGKGAAIGTAVGGGVGTGAVVMTRGDEVELAAGTPLTVQLTAPLTVTVRIR